MFVQNLSFVYIVYYFPSILPPLGGCCILPLPAHEQPSALIFCENNKTKTELNKIIDRVMALRKY